VHDNIEARVTAMTECLVLGINELEERLYHPSLKERLVVSPLIKPHTQDGTIDIRLGTKFIMTQRTSVSQIDPLDVKQEKIPRFLQRVDLPMGSPITIHPRMLLLAATLEYICLPLNLCASVVTRSTYGRLGLISATAIHVHPGYRGCLTLELVNFGDIAIRLYPGIRIAQLVIYQTKPSTTPEKPKYQLVTEPQFPKLWDEDDYPVLDHLKKEAAELGITSATYL
jgi:dCTP deaminase